MQFEEFDIHNNYSKKYNYINRFIVVLISFYIVFYFILGAKLLSASFVVSLSFFQLMQYFAKKNGKHNLAVYLLLISGNVYILSTPIFLNFKSTHQFYLVAEALMCLLLLNPKEGKAIIGVLLMVPLGLWFLIDLIPVFNFSDFWLSKNFPKEMYEKSNFIGVYITSIVFIFAYLYDLYRVLEQYQKSQEKNKYLQEMIIQSAKTNAIGEMASGMAHEINNPLMVIQGSMKQLKRDFENPELEIKINKIENAVKRIDKIINALKTFTKVNQKSTNSHYFISEIVEDSLNLYQERINLLGIKLIIEKVPNCQIECIKSVIIHVVYNLINNSIDALENVKDPYIRIYFEIKSSKLNVFIEDNGAGIRQEYADSIFNPFFTTKALGKGVGIGMSTSKNIIENVGGKIYLINNQSPTLFCVSLPFISPL